MDINLNSVGNSTGWIIVILACIAAFFIVANLLGNKAETVGKSAGSNLGYVCGFIAALIVLAFVPGFVGLEAPSFLTSVWSFFQQVVDTVLDLLTGKGDNALTGFEVKRIVTLFLFSSVIIIFMFRMWSFIPLIIWGIILFRLASTTEITPLPGEVAVSPVAHVYTPPGDAYDRSATTIQNPSIFDETASFVSGYWKFILAGIVSLFVIGRRYLNKEGGKNIKSDSPFLGWGALIGGIAFVVLNLSAWFVKQGWNPIIAWSVAVGIPLAIHLWRKGKPSE